MMHSRFGYKKGNLYKGSGGILSEAPGMQLSSTLVTRQPACNMKAMTPSIIKIRSSDQPVALSGSFHVPLASLD
jgi:hypothetical protein